MRLETPERSVGGPVLVEARLLKSAAHADGRVSRITACANYCIQRTAGRLTAKTFSAALAGRR